MRAFFRYLGLFLSALFLVHLVIFVTGATLSIVGQSAMWVEAGDSLLVMALLGLLAIERHERRLDRERRL